MVTPLDNPVYEKRIDSAPVPRPPLAPRRRWGEFGLSLLLLCGILALAWHFAGLLMEQTNRQLGPERDPVTGQVRGDQDQKHNLNQTLKARRFHEPDPSLGTLQNLQRWLPHETDGVVAPLWPWVASRLASKAHVFQETEVSDEDRELFQKGKTANVYIALAFTWALGLALARVWRPAAVTTVLLLGTFGALLPRAVYFQPETLYYVFFFLAWVCAVKLLFDNKIWLHALFGVFAGLAYLAKTSVEPLLLCWFLASAVRFAREAWREEDPLVEPRWTCRNFFVGCIALALGWLAVTGPRYAYAWERWGDPRHTYPGYWMWFDNFEDCFQWMLDHPDKKTLEAIPPGEKPSLSLYARTHTPEQMRDRLVNGTVEKVTRFLSPKPVKQKKNAPFPGWRHLLERRGVYLIAPGALLLFGGIVYLCRHRAGREAGVFLPSGWFAASLFVIGAFVGYSLAYGWYDPIGRGDRFMLSLYLPLVFSLIQGGEHLMNFAAARGAPRWTGVVYQTVLWGLNAVVLWRLVEILRLPVFDPRTL